MVDMNVNMNITQHLENNQLDLIKFQKMVFLFNAVENGWHIKKKNKAYIFSKKNENKEAMDEDYLSKFIKEHIDLNTIIIKNNSK